MEAPEISGQLGFIGLGSQGAPMAMRMIEAGREVVLWARRSETLEAFSDSGATFADSIADLARQVQYCGICVLDDSGVREVCNELLPAMAHGSYVVIHSTVHPDTCTELEGQARERGLCLIDAPVSGGGGAADNRTLTVMAGGEKTAVEAVRSVFQSFAGLIVHLGKVGAGQQAKLVNNAQMAANMAVAHHAMASAAALAIDRAAMVELVKASSGRSFGFETYARLSRPEDFAFGGKLLTKDVSLLEGSLEDEESAVALCAFARSFLNLTTKV